MPAELLVLCYERVANLERSVSCVLKMRQKVKSCNAILNVAASAEGGTDCVGVENYCRGRDRRPSSYFVVF